MFQVIAHLFASNPPSILLVLVLGRIGYLLGIAGAGLLLTAGILLQVGWLARFFI